MPKEMKETAIMICRYKNVLFSYNNGVINFLSQFCINQIAVTAELYTS